MDENKNIVNDDQNTMAPETAQTPPAGEPAPQEPISHAKKKRKRMPTWLKVIIILLVIVVAVFVVLYLTAWIAGFDSIADLLDYIWVNTKELFGKTKTNNPPALN